MRDRILGFFSDIDRALAAEAAGAVLEVYHIGRSAVLWEYGGGAATSDVDILQPSGGGQLVELALRRFGRGTPKAEEHGLYLEVVPEALPPVPGGYKKRATPVEGPWVVLRVFHLDPHDLVATKLRRFAARDREDIRQLCDLGLINPTELRTTVERALWWTMDKDGDSYRDDTFANLRVVEDYLAGIRDEF